MQQVNIIIVHFCKDGFPYFIIISTTCVCLQTYGLPTRLRYADLYFNFRVEMADDLFTQDVVRDFIMTKGGRVTNHGLVSHFKHFLNDPSKKGGYHFNALCVRNSIFFAWKNWHIFTISSSICLSAYVIYFVICGFLFLVIKYQPEVKLCSQQSRNLSSLKNQG